ncbi:putative tubulin epsilon chain [Apostichopus japonicus]|uniref:Putative tubulin epsilon chain n=1 Tax=Stichopus japonicus TaxID=307972 RepID=A0A2G8K9Q1_STIJA|nr:putative tubulin epsilon chain [Apostichopus japonicus]
MGLVWGIHGSSGVGVIYGCSVWGVIHGCSGWGVIRGCSGVGVIHGPRCGVSFMVLWFGVSFMGALMWGVIGGCSGVVCHSWVLWCGVSFMGALLWGVIHGCSGVGCHSWVLWCGVSFMGALVWGVIRGCSVVGCHSWVLCCGVSFMGALLWGVIHGCSGVGVIRGCSVVGCHSWVLCCGVSFIGALVWGVIHRGSGVGYHSWMLWCGVSFMGALVWGVIHRCSGVGCHWWVLWCGVSFIGALVWGVIGGCPGVGCHSWVLWCGMSFVGVSFCQCLGDILPFCLKYANPPDLGVGEGKNKISSLKARAVLVDMEEGVVNELLSGSLRDVFDHQQMLTDVSGCGNNWAVATNCRLQQEQLTETIRLAAEHCDCLQCFFLIHSMGGGTGSGVGTAILSLLEDEYPDVYRFVTAVYPSADDDVITSPYNSVLAMKQLTDHADCVMPVENQALIDICQKISQAQATVSGGKRTYPTQPGGGRREPKRSLAVALLLGMKNHLMQ